MENKKKSMIDQILDYWYKIEFFLPSWPPNSNYLELKSPTSLPWPKEKNSKFKMYYDVYVGKVLSHNIIQWVLEELNETDNEKRIEPDHSSSCLFAYKLDENGYYVTGSFSISSFVWALCSLVQAHNIHTNLNMRKLEKLQQWFDSKLIEENTKIDYHTLEQHLSTVIHVLSLDASLCNDEFWVHEIKHYIKLGPVNPSTDLLSSFYTKDIALVHNNVTPNINKYVTSLIDESTHKVEIDTNIVEMQKWLSVDRYPLGKWPSKYSPSLMQQLSINLCNANNGIFSVNGPPGTGKTTLLKEVIASNIVLRSLLLSQYKHPDDAFTCQKYDNPPDEYSKFYYVPDANLIPYGILVASNNNSAVENISKELPKNIKDSLTNKFEYDAKNDIYFSDVATALIGENSWGLISARLGNKKNIKELTEQLWWNNSGYSLKRHLKEEKADWGKCKREFDIAYQAVMDERAKIEKVQKLVAKFPKLKKNYESVLFKTTEVRKEQNEALQRKTEYEKKLAQIDENVNVTQNNLLLLQHSLPFYKRWFPFLFRSDITLSEIRRIKENYSKLLIQRTRLSTLFNQQNNIVLEIQSKLQKQEEIFAEESKIYEEYCNLITHEKDRFGKNFADYSFWQDIANNETSQTACPWVTPEYDHKREELFYQAIQLQRAFVINCNYIQPNILSLMKIWNNKVNIKDKAASYSALLNTLFIVIPVISTTFASVQTFLDGVGAEELGTLVIDEAGQATPQSALGALWRTQRSIIVGDPLQVEPIMTIPSVLRNRFSDDYHLVGKYRSAEISVQNLADGANQFGGYRIYGDNSIWLGCPLIVHRRCIDPMFSISNTIAYNERMFSQTKQPLVNENFLFDKSVWLDIKGAEIGRQNHTVIAQNDKVSELIASAVLHQGHFPDVFLITPFKSVEKSLKQSIRIKLKNINVSPNDVNEWLSKSCGTIHKFQGKEANEVIIILGCDNDQGKKAAAWVGNTPNIINVAVTRAKYRLAVVGDRALWSKIPYVTEVSKYLDI